MEIKQSVFVKIEVKINNVFKSIVTSDDNCITLKGFVYSTITMKRYLAQDNEWYVDCVIFLNEGDYRNVVCFEPINVVVL